MTTDLLLDLIAFRCQEALTLAGLAAAGIDPLPSTALAIHGLTDVLALLAEYAADQEQQLAPALDDEDEPPF